MLARENRHGWSDSIEISVRMKAIDKPALNWSNDAPDDT